MGPTSSCAGPPLGHLQNADNTSCYLPQRAVRRLDTQKEILKALRVAHKYKTCNVIKQQCSRQKPWETPGPRNRKQTPAVHRWLRPLPPGRSKGSTVPSFCCPGGESHSETHISPDKTKHPGKRGRGGLYFNRPLISQKKQLS